MKTGLFGGTFDPIHNGHIKVAQVAKDRLELDRILFIPAGDPPHKADKKITAKEDRLSMVELAVQDSGALVSDWELCRAQKSYSVDMIKHFMEVYPEDELYFIIGADSFYDLPSWWHYRELLTLCSFIVIARPDTEKDKLLARFEGTETPPRVYFLEDILMDISSTRIREMVSEGKNISRLVPRPVQNYIENRGLYR